MKRREFLKAGAAAALAGAAVVRVSETAVEAQWPDAGATNQVTPASEFQKILNAELRNKPSRLRQHVR